MNTPIPTLTPLENAFQRIQAIAWTTIGTGEPHNIHTDLMRQYLHRGQQWAKHLNTGRRHEFQNLATHLDPSLDLPPAILAWLDHLFTDVYPYRGRHYVIWGLTAYLCWVQLPPAITSTLPPLPDPYEPLLQFFEHGGAIYVEHGIFLTIYPNAVGFTLSRDRS
jgi:hypothetical protein